MGKVIFSIFLSPIAVIVLAITLKRKLKNDPEKAKNYKTFGVLSLISSVLLVGLAFPVIWLTVQLFELTFSYLGIFTQLLLIGNIFLGMLAIEIPIIYFAVLIATIVFPISQLTINRRPIGWIALIVAIIAIIGVIVLCSYFITNGVLNNLFG